MKIHINAGVICGDEVCGKVGCVIVDPTNDEITHFVCKVEHFPLPPQDYLVPIKHVVDADEQKVTLDCAADELTEMEDFIKHEFVPSGTVIRGYGSEQLRKPFMLMTKVEEEKVPQGELAIHRGAKVFAKKEPVGKIDDFLVSSNDDLHITHIVLREGHFWSEKDITIPVSEIEKIEKDGIFLKLGKDEIENLPSVKVHGWFH